MRDILACSATHAVSYTSFTVDRRTCWAHAPSPSMHHHRASMIQHKTCTSDIQSLSWPSVEYACMSSMVNTLYDVCVYIVCTAHTSCAHIHHAHSALHTHVRTVHIHQDAAHMPRSRLTGALPPARTTAAVLPPVWWGRVKWRCTMATSPERKY